ncbi:sialate O-acetylesterase [Spirosoma daeguense]
MKRLAKRLLFLSILTAQTALAEVKLPNTFGSHMVLQRRRPVPVWGWADSGEKVTVSLNNQTKTVKAAKDGKWQVMLDPMEAGGPYQMLVKGKTNTVTFDDILMGEVWVCSGQSNMEWPLSAAANAKTEIAAANYPNIRQLLVKKVVSLTPKEDIEGSWTVCSPETAPKFTAVGYFFARQLQQELNVPIGLINTSWGGTHSETWTSREAMLRDPDLNPMVVDLPSSLSVTDQKLRGRLKVLVQEKQGGILPTAAEEKTWANSDFNDSEWLKMGLPKNWDFQGGLPNFDGIVWFRHEIIIPSDADLKNATLLLGTIDDADSTFVNGQFVGTTDGYNVPRQYKLADGILKPGRNIIAVRVKDTGSTGGFTGESDKLAIATTGGNLSLAGDWRYRIGQVQIPPVGNGPNAYGTLLYNAMLNPLIPYAIAGTIWYQGESNAGRAYQYRKSFPLMIQDWRQRWGYDFPFLFVQLASFKASDGDSKHGSSWAELREAQTMTLKLPNTGMAVTSDIGERNDIHPKNKQDVGKRLAAEAMRISYPQTSTLAGEISRGPMFDKMTVTGNQASVTFRNADGGIWVKDKYGYVKGFEVAGADQIFHYAKAEIQGNTVVVHTDSVATPVAVRYGWADDNGDVNLYNQAGFPAVPFRSDTWKGITEAVKFGDR